MVFLENDFIILFYGRTIIGASEFKELVAEDITRKNTKVIAKYKALIRTILFDSVTRTLFVGDSFGFVRQYQQSKRSNFLGLFKESLYFSLLKDYGNVGVGWVLSSSKVGGFAIFGGSNNSLVAIDISEQQLCKGVIKSPFEKTYSLRVCFGVYRNVYLSVGGENPDYSSIKSDCLEVDQLYNHPKTKPSHYPLDMDQFLTFPNEEEESINALKLKIQELESQLQIQKNHNKCKSKTKICKPESTLFCRKKSHEVQKKKNQRNYYSKREAISSRRTYCYSKPSIKPEKSTTGKLYIQKVSNLKNLTSLAMETSTQGFKSSRKPLGLKDSNSKTYCERTMTFTTTKTSTYEY